MDGQKKQIPDRLILHICTPNGEAASLECDSIRFSIPDGENGKGGGSIGIRPGHIPALIAMAPGTLTASLRGEQVYSAPTGSGFVSVSQNIVTVLAE